MSGDQLTDFKVLDTSYIIQKETWAVLCTESLQGRTLYLSQNTSISSGRIQQQIVSSFTCDFMFCNTTLSPINLKAPTAWKTNSLDPHPWMLMKTSTECLQCSIYLISNGYSRKREEENGKRAIVSSLINVSLQLSLSREAREVS